MKSMYIYMEQNLLAPLGEVRVLDHTDCVATPFLHHVAHHLELVYSPVVLQDGVVIHIIIIATCKYYVLTKI